ncbi:MAG: hypothetical protein WKF34_07430 [Pyrinomonadaceae bacterium]
MRVSDIYKNDEVIALPGADLSRTLGFLIIAILIGLIVNTGDLVQIRSYQRTSMFMLLISWGLAVGSAYHSYRYLNLQLDEIKNPAMILIPKFLLTVSISIFFLTIGIWIVILGGIWSSPYAALLSVSPILYGVQMLYAESAQREACLRFIDSYEQEQGDSHEDSFMTWYRRNNIFSYLPLLVVALLLVVGYRRIDLFEDFEGGLIAVLDTNWYYFTYAVIYYSSVVLAIGATLPVTTTKRITKWLFFTG